MLHSELSLIERLNQLTEEHLDDPNYSIDDLCRELGVSRSHLYRVVKEQSGLSTSLYIRHRRLLKARQLLEHTDWRVSEIAFRVGFDRSQTLSKYFTEAFGQSPSDYRSQQAEASDINPVADNVSTPAPYSPTTEPIAPAKPASRNRWMWLAGFGLLLLAGMGWAVVSTFQTKSNASAQASIAVLPFKNRGSAETRYFSDGVMEQIHRSLSRLESLKVISRASAMTYEQTTKPLPQIARELDVAYLLEGQVLQVGKRVKLSVELILASENRTVWSNAYEGDEQAIFDFMSQVANQIATELHQKLSSTIRQQLSKSPTRNINAYNEYLKGQYFLRDRAQEGVEGSLLSFEKALALDPNFADAYAGKAMAYFLIATEEYGPVVSNSLQAEKEALKAIRLDDQNAQAYSILAKLYMEQGKWEQANTTFLIALQYSPNDALINYCYSLLLRTVGQLDRAVDYSTKALALDPLLPVIMIGHIGNLVTAQQWAEADRVIQEGNRLHRNVANWYYATSFYYLCRQQYPMALRELEKGRHLAPRLKAFLVRTAFVKARMGQPQAAKALLDSLPDNLDHNTDKAELWAGVLDKDHCLTYLEKGANMNRLPYYLKVTPLYAFLHDDPRFKALLKRVGL